MGPDIFSISAVTQAWAWPFFTTNSLLPPMPDAGALFDAPIDWSQLALPSPLSPLAGYSGITLLAAYALLQTNSRRTESSAALSGQSQPAAATLAASATQSLAVEASAAAPAASAVAQPAAVLSSPVLSTSTASLPSAAAAVAPSLVAAMVAAAPVVPVSSAAAVSVDTTADTPADGSSLFVLGGVLPGEMSDVAVTSAASGLLVGSNVAVALRADTAQSEFGVTGAGIKIGILSDSFNVLGGMAEDIADGNLPANVQILREGPAGSHDEGRAMAEIVHSIAPGASIVFTTAVDGEASFASGIAALQAAGCNVIVDDVAYLDEPFFQDGGVVQTAVENAVASGVDYFTAASNEGNDFIQQTFSGMPVVLPGLPAAAMAQNFGSAAAPQPWANVVVPTGGELELDMQWAQPFASIGTSAGAANSLGMALYNSAGQLVASATSNDVGGNPDQILTFTNESASTAYRLVVYSNGGAASAETFKIINYGSGNISGGGQGSGTVIGHEMVTGANTVGAMAWSSTPAYGGNDTAESFSSEGTGQFLYGANGQALATPESASKVNFLAPDGDVTSVFAPFYGTSAAAPAAAAVAALMLQADPSLTTTQVTSLLEQSALPAYGAANATGAGLIQADTAVKLALQLAHTS